MTTSNRGNSYQSSQANDSRLLSNSTGGIRSPNNQGCIAVPVRTAHTQHTVDAWVSTPSTTKAPYHSHLLLMSSCKMGSRQQTANPLTHKRRHQNQNHKHLQNWPMPPQAASKQPGPLCSLLQLTIAPDACSAC